MENLCTVEAKRYATITLAHLNEEHSDEHLDSLWEDVLFKCSKFGVKEPTLPHKQRAPTHLDDVSGSTHHDTPRDMYRRLYFEIVAKLKGETEHGFDSPTFSLYSKVETVLFGSCYRRACSRRPFVCSAHSLWR